MWLCRLFRHRQGDLPWPPKIASIMSLGLADGITRLDTSNALNQGLWIRVCPRVPLSSIATRSILSLPAGPRRKVTEAEQSWTATAKATGHPATAGRLVSEPREDQQSWPGDTQLIPKHEQRRHVTSTEVFWGLLLHSIIVTLDSWYTC